MRLVYAYDEQAPGGRELLGGKGVGLAEMTALGIPVPAGFTITTDACRATMSGGEVPEELWPEVDDHVARLEEKTGKRFGDAADPLLVSVRSGAAVSMPGMMDTILNLGLNDVAVEGLAAATGNPRFAFDSYRRLIQMYGEVVDGIDGHVFEGELQALKEARGARLDVELTADDLRGLIATFQELYEREVGSPFPAGRPRAAATRHARRVRLVGVAACACLSPHVRHPGRPRHRRERRPDGVRQQGGHIRDGRLLHARPVDRRAAALRRVPRQRAGRGRRRRNPDARADRAHARAAPGRLRPPHGDARAARGALPRDAGHRVHRRGGGALPAPDANREADGAGRAPDRRRDDRGRPHLARGGRHAHRPGTARSAAPPDDRPGRDRRRRRDGAERVAGGRLGGDRARRGPRRGPRSRGRGRAARPVGDDARRHPRPDPRERRPDGARRDDLARGGRRTRHGQAVRGGLRGALDRPRRTDGAPRRGRAPRGRPPDDRRRHGPRDRRHGAARPARDRRELRDDPRLGRRDPSAPRARERRHAGGCREGPRVRRRGDRPLPDGAHVHGAGPAARRAGDDPGERRARPPRRARPASSGAAVRLRGDLRGDGRLPRDHPSARPAAPRVPAVGGGRDVGHDAPPDRAAPRGQPDARHARLPAGPAVPGDLRDAGARDRACRAGGAGAVGRGAARRDHASARRRSARSCAGSASSPSGSPPRRPRSRTSSAR